MTPLSCCIAGYGPRKLGSAPAAVERLSQLNFPFITLSPAYAWNGSLLLASGPSLQQLAHTAALAADRGMAVIIEPHLEYPETLAGGAYRWRGELCIDPGGEYLSHLMAPLVGLLSCLPTSGYLTLGSELDLSLSVYADGWNSIRAALSAEGIRLGHKINHDFTHWTPAVAAYLRELDYVAVSFYPPYGRWQVLRRLRRRIATPLAVGEFGLGSADCSRPWQWCAADFQVAENRLVRRRFYLRMLDRLRRTDWLEYASFWTAGAYDVLGIHNQPSLDDLRDDTVIEAVASYNQKWKELHPR